MALASGRACTETGAICTGDWHMLSNSLSANGSPGLRAQLRENVRATTESLELWRECLPAGEEKARLCGALDALAAGPTTGCSARWRNDIDAAARVSSNTGKRYTESSPTAIQIDAIPGRRTPT